MSEHPKMRFSHNWNNKLDCAVFSTIRKASAWAVTHYSKYLGHVFDIVLHGDKRSEATLIGMKSSPLRDVPDEILWLDTGYPSRQSALDVFRTFGVEEDDEVLQLFFHKVSK